MNFISKSFKQIEHNCWKLIEQEYPEVKDKNQLSIDLFQKSLLDFENRKLTVLDAGCGHHSGRTAQERDKITYIGTDMVLGDIKANKDINYGFVSNLSAIPLKSSSVDIIVSNMVFEHLTNPETVFSEFNRVLKTRGYIIFLTPCIYGIVTILNSLIPDVLSSKLAKLLTGQEEGDVFPTAYKANSVGTLRKLLQGNGFVEIDLLMYQPPPYAFVFSTIICKLVIYYYHLINKYDRLAFLRGVIIARYQKVSEQKQDTAYTGSKSLPVKKKCLVFANIIKQKVLEFVRYDSKAASLLLFLFYSAHCFIIKCFSRKLNYLTTLGNIFRHTQFDWCRNYASSALKNSILKYGPETVGSFFLSACDIGNENTLKLQQSILTCHKPFDSRLIILSPPEQNKRGVLFVKFTENFKYLPFVFDLGKLCKDYILVLEPSFCGYYDPDILGIIGQTTEPIVIQSPEKIDYQFFKSLGVNFVPADLGANCWVDNKTFFPINDMPKQYDIIMVALWSDFKRHYHLFEALSKSQNKDNIKVALVGVPWPKSLKSIKDLARYYKVDHCIEYFESISQQEINILLNKSKVSVILSKKEGVNKAIIESMYTDTPSFLLHGFNYGQHYYYINSETGGYIEPSQLSEFIDQIDHMLYKNKYSPNKWVAEHLSFETSRTKLIELMSEIEKKENIKINKNMQCKINNPDYDYVDSSYWIKYSIYYKQLKSYLK